MNTPNDFISFVKNHKKLDLSKLKKWEFKAMSGYLSGTPEYEALRDNPAALVNHYDLISTVSPWLDVPSGCYYMEEYWFEKGCDKCIISKLKKVSAHYEHRICWATGMKPEYPGKIWCHIFEHRPQQSDREIGMGRGEFPAEAMLRAVYDGLSNKRLPWCRPCYNCRRQKGKVMLEDSEGFAIDMVECPKCKGTCEFHSME